MNFNLVCYLNSALQQLYNIPKFRHAILFGKENENVDSSQRVLYQLQNIFSNLLMSEKSYTNAKTFCSNFFDFDGLPVNINEQKDSFEFISLLFDKLEDQIQEKDRDFIKNIFAGKLKYQIVSKECTHISSRE